MIPEVNIISRKANVARVKGAVGLSKSQRSCWSGSPHSASAAVLGGRAP